MAGTIHRPIRWPDKDLSERKLPVWEGGVAFVRVHETGRSPCFFSRNPAHRYSPVDGLWAVCYVAETVETCLWERFGDDVLSPGARVARSLWMTRSVTRGRVEGLRICDLTQSVVRESCRVDLSALQHTDLTIPQAWSRALQEHPDRFDAVRYGSRFDGGACLALFGREGLEQRIRWEATGALATLDEGERFLDERGIALV